ncbi:uncharacterized protein K452DRAFT_308644 [Aplosporella prunicola CBS 121167]|uniref:AAA+ ATPase domain-containing protein n=1 Tax=Aplosporella prunicola CBS 121167 TaxID=1176127 RepID=A0A6A6BG98_9PEZI|nr:uncharacterized protein K452DRAFT_308644 [Aplosporella prunicola CBS 121167]KAF2141541.1 hypothetical protein K452DRAFT_308644 [Aplosporella prunicola CBS 121167]
MVDAKNNEAIAQAENEKPIASPCAIRYKVECEDQFGPDFECEQNDKPFDLKVSEKSVIQQAGPAPVIEIITKLNVATKMPKYKWPGMGMNWNTWGQKDDDRKSAFGGTMGMGGGTGGFAGMFPGAYGGMADSESESDSEDEKDDEKKDGEKKDAKDKKEKKPVKPSLDNKRINKINATRMVVHSPWLLKAIRDVVQYYPAQNLTGDTITIHEPYHVLAHHVTELRDLRNRLALEKGSEDDEEDDAATTYEHLKVLLDFIEPHVERTVLPARRRLKKEEATTTYDDLWYLLRPGALAYAQHDDTWIGCVIKSVSYSEENEDEKKATAKVWFLDHTWSSSRISRSKTEIEIPYFEGEKVVSTLNVYPREYLDRVDGGKRREAFIARGEKARDIAYAGHSYRFYDGRDMSEDKKHVKGPIVAESQYPYWANFPNHKWGFSNQYGDEEGAIIYDQGHLQKNSVPRKLKPLEYDAGTATAEALNDDHRFLLCPVMVGFSLANKSWQPLNVDFMTDVPFPKKTPDANIEAENLNIIKALSYRQTKSKLAWSADFIKNKGEGVVVLLHGPPGVGKTYTVETTAIHTRRPLVALTIGDLGSNESSIEDELARWFDLATRWRAVLLIDEADIFLEKRRTSDLARNGVVTAFLRRMEYFGGLLFLTTNRIDTMDDAFMSRVHVVVGFDSLDAATRKAIMESFFQKLSDEMGSQIRVSPEAKNYLLTDKEVANLDWNGREIRNAIQTAIALAEYEASEKEGFREEDGILVDAHHFRKVVATNGKFKKYVEETRTPAPKDTDSEWADV